MDSLQPFIVALLVPGCALYAAWKLMPAAARRAFAAALLRVPGLPAPFAAALRLRANAATGCGCDGCDHAERTPAATAVAPGNALQPITFHRRPPPR